MLAQIHLDVVFYIWDGCGEIRDRGLRLGALRPDRPLDE